MKVFLGIVKEGSPTGTQTGSSSVHDTIRTWTTPHRLTSINTHSHITGLYKIPRSKHFGTQSRMETHTVTFQQQTQSVICVTSPH